MQLTRYKLGKLIELCNERNTDLRYGFDDVRGVNSSKQFINTKADLNGRDLSKFQIVNPGDFVFNHRTSRNGSKFSIAYNDSGNSIICTEDYVVFRIGKDSKEILLNLWLYMYFNRSEFDRFVITNSWGSSTEFYNWEDIKNIDIDLPPLPIQEKVVAIYNGLVKNQQSYERGLEDLKLVCDAYIENLRRDYLPEEIGNYISRKNDKNIDNKIKKVFGLSTSKEFREPQSRVNKKELSNYKVVDSLDFVFVPTTDTWKVLAFAINDYQTPIVISPIYEVFSVCKNKIQPEYLALWLHRNEFDRYARFHSWGSARENFTWDDMCSVRIPIPDIKVQKSIANVYKVYKKRKDINEKLKKQIKDICPILIKGSIEEAKALMEA